MKTYVVTKPLPQGQQPGETIDLTDDFAKVLLLVDAIKPLDPDPPQRSRGRYRRTDLTAEHTEELTAKE